MMNKKIKVSNLFLLILVAIFFFIAGNMMHQIIFYPFVKYFLSSAIKNLSNDKKIDVLTKESQEINGNLNHSMDKEYLRDNGKSLKFLVAGHVSGNPYGYDNYHPAMTIQTNLQSFNLMDLDMIVLLGDIVQKTTEENFNNFETNFLQYIEKPVFNAVGNHDMQDRNLYIQKFGETNFSFIYKDNLFIFLDTNIEPYSLSENQLSDIKVNISETSADNKIIVIQIFAHHVFFFSPSLISKSSKNQTNEFYSMKTNVDNFFKEYLIPISISTPVYIYTGDVGGLCGNLSPYYEKIDGSNITAVATGIGNCEEDSVLIVQEINGEIFIEPYSLVGKEMLPIESYNNIYWNEQ